MPHLPICSATQSVAALNEILIQNSEAESVVPHRSSPPQELPPDTTEYPLECSKFRDVAFPHGLRQLHRNSDALPASAESKILLDLAPRTLLAAGGMVELMVRTKVGHYIDFRALEATYVAFADHGLRHVPASRADVFQNRFITMLEKRLLMRFVKSAMTEPPASVSSVSEEESVGLTFEDEMRLASLTEKLKTFLNYGVALSVVSAADIPALDARESVALFQRSLMRFGTRTPFLYSNYGSSELSQAFCRLSAVHGGTYVLRRGVTAVVAAKSDEDSESPQIVRVVTDNGEHVECKALISTASALKGVGPDNSTDSTHTGSVWRAMCVLDGSIVSESSSRVLVVIPKGTLGNKTATVRLRQLDSTVSVCPPGNFVLYAETMGGEGNEADVKSVLENYVSINADINQDGEVLEAEGNIPFTGEEKSEPNGYQAIHDDSLPSCEADQKPRLLWGAVYSRSINESPALRPSKFDGLYLMAEGGAESDAAFCLEMAQIAFDQMLPDATFFESEGDKQPDDLVDGEQEQDEIVPQKTNED